MNNNIFKWLSWIIIGFGLTAGFAAQAANLNPVIIVKSGTGVIQCKLRSAILTTDSRVSGDEFSNYEECWKSKTFNNFNGIKPLNVVGEHRIWYSNFFNFVFCGTLKATDPGDYLISAKRFADLGACSKSRDYKEFNKKYSSNDIKPPGLNGKKPVVSKPTPKKPKPVVLTKIQKYIKIFEDKTGITVGKTGIKLGNLTKGTLGICYGKDKQIVIDRAYWNGNTSEYDKELTIYHELGHCVLNRAHYNPKNMSFYSPSLQKKCPISIMHWSAFGALNSYRCFHEHRKYYWKELVTGTFAMRAYKQEGNGKEEKLFSYYLQSKTSAKKIGSFSCSFTLGDPLVLKTSEEIWIFAHIKCTRDQVIIFETNRFYKTSVGANRIKNLKILAQNQIELELSIHDKILNQKFRVLIKKVSTEIW